MVEDSDGREEEAETETDLRTELGLKTERLKTELGLKAELGLKTEIALLNSSLDRGASLCRYRRISEHFGAVELMVTVSWTFQKVSWEATMKVVFGGTADSSHSSHGECFA